MKGYREREVEEKGMRGEDGKDKSWLAVVCVHVQVVKFFSPAFT